MKTLELNEYGVSELHNRDLQLDGGGWIADDVAQFVHWLKCGCPKNQTHNSVILGTKPSHFM